MDTIPYLYDPWIRGFFNVSEQDFLSIADRWISRTWKVREDIGHWAKEERLHRFPENDFGMWSHSHGSDPVLERPTYYYEWHAMWCTLGELIRDRPLATVEDWSWNDFDERLQREMLTCPTMWLADWRDSKPLLARFWFAPEGEVVKWVSKDNEQETFAELGLCEAKRKEIVVAASHATQARSFRRDVSLSTALVSPGTARSLLRALQTTGHWMRYKVPSEDDHLEIDEAPYQFIGWLKDADNRDPQIDKLDPIRAEVREVQTGPGTAVLDFLDVPPSKRDLLLTSTNAPFRFEAWSDRSESQSQP